jgi:hypothetical protein
MESTEDISVSVTSTDANGNEVTSEGSSSIEVDLNQIPDAVDDTASTNEDSSITIDVLSNDTDTNSDSLSITQIEGQDVSDGQVVTITNDNGDSLGTATVVDGKVEFTPSSELQALDSGTTEVPFNYTVSDGNGGESTANVSVNVTSTGDASAPTLEMNIGDKETIPHTTTEETPFNDDTDHSMSEGSSGWFSGSTPDDSQTYDLGGETNSATINFNNFDGASGGWGGSSGDEATVELFDASGNSLGTQTIHADNLDSNGNVTINSNTEFSSMKITATDGEFTLDNVSATVETDVTTNSFEYDITLNAGLTDTDGSETLSDIIVDNLPDGATISGDGVVDNGDGTYTVTPNEAGDTTVTLSSATEIDDSALNSISASVTSTESNGGDSITVNDDEEIIAIDGGDDNSFDLGDGGFELDFDNVNVENVNTLDLGDGADTAINVTNLDASDVLDMTDDNNTLFVDGDSNDSVEIDASQWTQTDDVTVVADDGSSTTYHSYTANVDGIDSTMNLDIDMNQGFVNG